MLRRILPVLFIVFALGLLTFGCATREGVGTNKAAPPPGETPPPTEIKAPTPAATTASTGKIGVPECDDYLAKVDACVSGKVPEAARAAYKAIWVLRSRLPKCLFWRRFTRK